MSALLQNVTMKIIITATELLCFLLQVIDPINKLIDTVEFDAVFYSLDWHPADHVSFIDNIKQRPIYPTSPVSSKICKIALFNIVVAASFECLIIGVSCPLRDV